MENSSTYVEKSTFYGAAARMATESALRRWSNWILPAVIAYPLLSMSLRFQRLRSMRKRFNYPTREPFSRMTDDDAWAIQNTLMELEFPALFEKGLQFALFRTYGIPTISKLLVKTSQFSKAETAMKRYADTGAIISEFISNPPSHTRAIEGIARLNYLHGIYRDSRQILDDDMLYTIALFAIEPIKWINRYEWRQLTDLERCAMGTFWKSVGDAMLIEYKNLPSSKEGFKDGLQWLEEIWAWAEAYEQRVMVPDKNNKQTADETTTILIWPLPESLKSVGQSGVSAMMDDRLRKAMVYPAPPPVYPRVLNTFFTIRRFYLRYLALPRPSFMRHRTITDYHDKNGRYFFKRYDAQPFYVKPTFMNRWGPGAWFYRLMGLPVPGDDGESYGPNGYYVPEVGPKAFLGKEGNLRGRRGRN